MSDGTNELRWKCIQPAECEQGKGEHYRLQQGCFNLKLRPKIQIFASCLPRNVAFTDVDAVTEINNHQLWLEWKSWDSPVPPAPNYRIDSGGQLTLFKSQVSARPHNHVFIVFGNAETMQVVAVQDIWSGGATTIGPVVPCDLEGLKAMIRAWGERAEDISWTVQ